jgi:hypothetical protein
MFRTVVIVTCLLFSLPAFAQSGYLAGSVGVEIFRADRVEGPGFDSLTATGEATALSLRVGTAITDRWGVELEVTRPSEIEHEVEPSYPFPLFHEVLPAGVALPNVASLIPLPRMRLMRRNTTVDAVAWIVQPVSDRVDLVYVGGIAFSRVTEDREFDFRFAPQLLVVQPSVRSITSGVGPVAGIEARVALTDHLLLLPGVRLHAVDDNTVGGWLARSSVGLGWRF